MQSDTKLQRGGSHPPSPLPGGAEQRNKVETSKRTQPSKQIPGKRQKQHPAPFSEVWE